MLYETWIYTNMDSMREVLLGLTTSEPDPIREAVEKDKGRQVIDGVEQLVGFQNLAQNQSWAKQFG
jgi:hypothetical protein